MFFTYTDSPLGPIFLAGEGASVHRCSFTIGCQVRHPEDDWVESAEAMAPAATQFREYFEGKSQSFDLDVTPSGTEFQKSVWQALRDIPFGETRTYAQVAESVGKPQAARAVGMANAANYLPLIIPCHRVVGASGSLTGFGAGLDAKRWLLRFEKDLSPTAQLALPGHALASRAPSL